MRALNKQLAYCVDGIIWILLPRQRIRYIVNIPPYVPLHVFLTRMSIQAKLTVVSGKASKRTIALQLPTSIGRSRDAGLTVAHPQISRKHCELIEADGLILIRDAGSLNGTYVNSHRVKEAPLPPDTTFSIGPLTFRVRYQYNGDTSELPPTIPAEEPAQQPNAGEISETLPGKGESFEEKPDDKKSVTEECPPNDATDDVNDDASDAADDALDDFLKGLT